MKCPLCGYNRIVMEECRTCPMARHDCAFNRCPNCGYTFPRDSSLARLIKRILRLKKPADDTFVNR